MSDLKCIKCGTRKSYADANIADLRRTCGATTRRPNKSGKYNGEKHDWVEV